MVNEHHFQMFAIFSSCLTFSGRLTLRNYAFYFEPAVGLYDKAVKYELATDLKQVIKPELTGPLGARLFDKAVMYKFPDKCYPFLCRSCFSQLLRYITILIVWLPGMILQVTDLCVDI